MSLKSIISCLALVISSTLWSQVSVKANVLGTFNPGSCNNSVVIETFNQTPYDQVWRGIVNNPQIQQIGFSDTLNNFCIYDITSGDNGTVNYIHSNGYLFGCCIWSTIIPQHLNYSTTNYTSPSSELAFDGSITFVFDSAIVLSDYNIYGFQSPAGMPSYDPDTVSLDAFTLRFDSVTSGNLHLYISNPLDSLDFVDFTIYIGDALSNFVSSGLDVAVSYGHAQGNCAGWISTQATNAVGNVLNVWNDQSYNTFLKTNLCPGLYSTYTYDEVGGVYQAGSIDTVIIVDDSTTYIDSMLYSISPQDTVFINFANCAFDFNAPIDSIAYYEDTVFDNGSLAIVIYEMTLYQDSSFVIVTDSMTLVNDSLIMIDVIVYCAGLPKPEFEYGNKMGFEAQRILFLRGVDGHYLLNNDLDVAEIEEKNFKIYPNPTREKLNIDFSSIDEYEIHVYSLSGTQVIAPLEVFGESCQLNLESVSSGTYIIQIVSEGIADYQRFVKE